MSASSEQFPRVSSITLNWNGKDDTVECVASLRRLNYPNYDIVVVDNGSTDGSVSTLRAQYPDITIIENGRNLGYAEGFNTGLRYATQQKADYSLILNNDTVIDPSALAELVRVAERDPRIGFVSGKVYFYDEPNRLQTVGRLSHPVLLVYGQLGSGEEDQGQYDEVRECDFIDDVFLLVRQAVFEEVGGYDPTFFLMYEETDWCARVRRAGFKIAYAPSAKIWHKGHLGASSGRSPIHQFYLSRNSIPFVRRNGSRAQFRRFLLTYLFSYKPNYAPRIAWRLLRRGYYRLALAHLRGVGSGLVWLCRTQRVTPRLGGRSQTG